MTFAAVLAVQQQPAAQRYNGMTKRRPETSLRGADACARARKTGARARSAPVESFGAQFIETRD